jgi:hypothetical protein
MSDETKCLCCGRKMMVRDGVCLGCVPIEAPPQPVETKCPECGGSGRYLAAHPVPIDCRECAGAGWLSPDYPVEPTPGGRPHALSPLPWRVRPDWRGTIQSATGEKIAGGLYFEDAAFIVRAVNASQRSEPVGQGGVARERVEDSDEE